ncbi:MAG: helix-turn-helix domain-containing protein [Caulobacterales bacterium]
MGQIMFQTPGSTNPGDEPGRANAPQTAAVRMAPADILGPDLGAGLRAGDKLSRVRQGRGLTLEDVARALMMPAPYVEALESMNVKLLPGTGYVAPYLKRYAGFLGFTVTEAEALTAQFRSESALAREGAQPQVRNPHSKPRQERPWIWAAAIAAVAVSFVGVKAFNAAKDPRDLRAAQRAPAAAQAPAPSPPPPVLAQAAVKLELRAVAAEKLDVRGEDGTVFYSRQMQQGDGYLPEIGANWVVHTQNGGAFLVVVDGHVVGPLGEEGSQVLGRPVDKILATAQAGLIQPAKPAATAAAPPRRPKPAPPAAAPSGGGQPPVSAEGIGAPPPSAQAVGATG